MPRNGPSENRMCWQRVELGIHGLNRWTVNCIEMYGKCGVHAARNGPSEERKCWQRVEKESKPVAMRGQAGDYQKRKGPAWFKRRSQPRGGWGRRPTPEGRRHQIRGWRAGGSLAVVSSTPATPLLSPAKIRELNHASSLRVKLVSESASGMASASISLPGATRNWVRLACVTCYEMLRFSAFSRICETRFSTQVINQERVVAICLSALIRRKLTQPHDNKGVAP